jgi:hypothetical protein
VARPALEVADIFRNHGAAWRDANRGHVSLAQLKVMSAIVSCRTAALGGHVARCEDCQHTTIAYNSCRNRHCPKCQGAAAREWMEERQAELLPVPYFHIVFTLPAAIGDIAYQNKAAIYALLFKASAETMLAIAADPKHLGARIAITSVLHTFYGAFLVKPAILLVLYYDRFEMTEVRSEPACSARRDRATSFYSVGWCPDHDAVMRIGSEAPKRRAHSGARHGSHRCARDTATSNRQDPSRSLGQVKSIGLS